MKTTFLSNRKGRGTEERRKKKNMGYLTKADYDGKVKL